MTNGTVWHQRDNTSSLFNNIKVPISKRVSEHWSKCHQSLSRRETEVNFYSTLVILVTLARCGSWHPQGQYVPRNNRHTLLFRQTGLDIFYSNPKQLLLQHATFHSPRPICDWRVFVSSPLSPGVCLPDTCLGLAKFCLDLISHREDLWRPSLRLALWISANSVPMSAVRDWRMPTQS